MAASGRVDDHGGVQRTIGGGDSHHPATVEERLQRPAGLMDPYSYRPGVLEHDGVEIRAPGLKAQPGALLVGPERLKPLRPSPPYPDACVPQEAGCTHSVSQPQLLQQRLDPRVQCLAWPVSRETRSLDEGDGEASLRAENRRRAAGRPAAEDDGS
jgi:hypothetical protein